MSTDPSVSCEKLPFLAKNLRQIPHCFMTKLVLFADIKGENCGHERTRTKLAADILSQLFW